MSTKTLAVAGSKRREPKDPDRVIRELRKATPLPQKVGESRAGAAKRRLPLAGTGGNRGRKVLEVRRAAVEEEVGVGAAADAGKNP